MSCILTLWESDVSRDIQLGCRALVGPICTHWVPIAWNLTPRSTMPYKCFKKKTGGRGAESTTICSQWLPAVSPHAADRLGALVAWVVTRAHIPTIGRIRVKRRGIVNRIRHPRSIPIRVVLSTLLPVRLLRISLGCGVPRTLRISNIWRYS